MTLSKPTQTLIDTIKAIPEIWDELNMIVKQDDETGNEYIVIWTKANLETIGGNEA